jgi:molecular chaperone DnaK (HSP70)
MTPKPSKSILFCDLGSGTYDLALVKSVLSGKYPYDVIDQDGLKIGGDVESGIS